MKKVLFLLLLIVVLILCYLLGIPDFDNEPPDCIGFFHEKYCVDKNTSEKTLIKIGLLEVSESENYELKISYPKNVIKYPNLHKHLKEQTDLVKKEFGFDNIDKNAEDANSRSLIISCEDSTDNVKYMSVLCRFTEYTIGGNPKHGFLTTNYNIKSEKIVELDDLFSNKSKVLKEISGYVINKIYSLKSERTGELIDKDEVIEKGASPLIGNYLNYIFVYENEDISGINFMFPNFQVGSNAEGSYEVFVPKEIYEEYLKVSKE